MFSRLICFGLLVLLIVGPSCRSKTHPSTEIPVEVKAVLPHPGLDAYFVVLSEKSSQNGVRVLPIVVGRSEGLAIKRAQENVRTIRPMTQDLLQRMMGVLHARVKKVVVTRVEEGTFFADLYIRSRFGKTIKLDCRPSDAVGLALKANAPIFVERGLMEKAGIKQVTPGEEALREKEKQGISRL